ncbi:hypothetical protein [Streptomyces sp. NPDC008125]|uniref:hypothetical protein n=1 Tax=Streptomyces sp. NPDC008125 TaxID=3364811 RepID=UPI0036E52D58
MTTQLIEPSVQVGTAEPEPSWRVSQRAASAALLAVSASVPAAPYCAEASLMHASVSDYRALLHYIDAASVLAIASAYDAEVLRTQPRGSTSSVTYTTDFTLDGVRVRVVAVVAEASETVAS